MRLLYAAFVVLPALLMVSCSGDSDSESNRANDAGPDSDASVTAGTSGTGGRLGSGGAATGGVGGGGVSAGGTTPDAEVSADASDASLDGNPDASGSGGSGGAGGSTGDAGGAGGATTVCQGGSPPVGAGGSESSGFPATDPPPCRVVGSACTSGGTCFSGPGAQVTSCRTLCDPSAGDGGLQGDCAADEVCTAEGGLVRYACLRRCTPFESPSVCDPGQWCYPTPDPSWTQNVSVEGLCVATSNLVDGDACPFGGCGPDLVCHSPDLYTLGTSHCEIACDINAQPGAPGACPAGEVCDAEAGVRGGCVRLCDPFAPVSTCPSAETCFPFEELESGTRVIEGHCVKPGLSPLGSRCLQGGCTAGLSCSVEPAPYNFEPAVCRSLCQPSNPSSCAAGESCVPYVNFIAVDVGTCVPSCTAWQADQCAAGCANGEWCAPSYLGSTSCVSPTGTGPLGGNCNYHNECGAGTFCDCRFQGQFDGCGVIDEAFCNRVCDPSAPAGSVGGCPTGEVCAPQSFLGDSAAFGLCRATCNFDAASGCPDPAETCVPGELLPQSTDTCYDIATPFPRPGGTCSPTDYAELEPCGPTSQCLLLPGQYVVRCEDLCRESASPIGTQDHPDCDDAASTCTLISAGLGYGVCR